MIVGIGVDVVSTPRIARMMQRWGDALAARVLTDRERVHGFVGERAVEYVAGRIAAKEAVSKALGAPAGIVWRDAEVVRAQNGAPTLVLHNVAHARARALGVALTHVSIAHEANVAVAMVVLERHSDGRAADVDDRRSDRR